MKSMRSKLPIVFFKTVYVWETKLIMLLSLVFCLSAMAGNKSALPGWNNFWSRENNRGSAVIDRAVMRPGSKKPSIRISHSGEKDWSLTRDKTIAVKKGNVFSLRGKDSAKTITLSNKLISVTVDTQNGSFLVKDLRANHTWKQYPSGSVWGLSSSEKENQVEIKLLDGSSGLLFNMVIEIDKDSPELNLSISAKGSLNRPLAFPDPFVTGKGSFLVIPMNEGISYPVDDPAISPMRLITYGGHGICMAFWGATYGDTGYMAIIETADDASIHIQRREKHLVVTPEWEAQKQRFGYTRKLRYVFLNRGGYVAMCKRYRRYVKEKGRLKTLAEKLRENPNVDMLIGAVNVWCWDRDPISIVKELKQAGIQRILWSHRGTPETIRAMNQMGGILSSRYDIYQDLMNPENFKFLWGVHPDWTTSGWPKQIMIDENGNWRRGWKVKCKDGKMRPCGVLCDMFAPGFAEKRISAELKTHPYRCRFIDTTTASPWRECYSPDHPMTRSESRKWKMKLLETISKEFKLVTGSETGHDAAVPYVHYFEGMLSLGPYRVPQAGRNMGEILYNVPERVSKFQVGHKYRLPLWELVYHDCVVAQWYWGDYNNKLPPIWDKRDLFNALYGTPPMFMFKRDFWRNHKERFVKSYKLTSPVARATGYSEMVDHRFLTSNRDVQQTCFANGVKVTVNFGEKAFQLKGGTVLKPMSAHFEGLK